jgi:hypothetical protein
VRSKKSLSPMSFDPDPSSSSFYPMACNPVFPAFSFCPVSPDPVPVSMTPYIVSWYPDIFGTWFGRSNLFAWRRRSHAWPWRWCAIE